jgi:hypothetical protein
MAAFRRALSVPNGTRLASDIMANGRRKAN